MKQMTLDLKVTLRKNSYTCRVCGGTITTLDIDEGVTPMFVLCRYTKGCRGDMVSAAYHVNPSAPHQYEWYKPDADELASIKDDGLLEHYRLGGLALRRREISSAVIEADIVEYVRSVDLLSAVMLQRKFRQTYMTAAVLLDKLVAAGIVFPERNSRGQHIVVQAEAPGVAGE